MLKPLSVPGAAADCQFDGDPSLTHVVSAVEDALDRWSRKQSDKMETHRRTIEDILALNCAHVKNILRAMPADGTVVDASLTAALPRPSARERGSFAGTKRDHERGGGDTATAPAPQTQTPTSKTSSRVHPGLTDIVPSEPTTEEAQGERAMNRTSTVASATGTGSQPSMATVADKMHKIKLAQNIPEMEGILDWQNQGAIKRRRTMRWMKIDCLKRFIESKPFSSFTSLMILCNTVFIGVQTEHVIQGAFERYTTPALANQKIATVSIPEWMKNLDLYFMGFFTFELMLRMLALEGEYFVGNEANWNIFDLFLVLTAICEKMLDFMNLSFLRVLRALRAVRALRVVRAMRIFRELRMMLLAVWSSAVPVFWALTFLMLVMFLVAIVVLNGIADHIEVTPQVDSIVEAARTYFSSVPMTMTSLFMCISGGQDWWEMGGPMLELHLFYGCIFALYIAITLYGILNIITGFFVESALEITRSDRDLLVQSAIKHEDLYIQSLRKLFDEFDKDGSGTISFPEFQDYLKMRHVQAYFKSLGLDATDAIMLFLILDADGTGEISLNEFVQGCYRIKGEAKNVDIAGMMTQHKAELEKLERAILDVQETLMTSQEPSGRLSHRGSVDQPAPGTKRLNDSMITQPSPPSSLVPGALPASPSGRPDVPSTWSWEPLNAVGPPRRDAPEYIF